MIARIKDYALLAMCAVLAGLLAWQTMRLHSSQLGAANERTQHAQTLGVIADLTAKAEKAVRAQETQWAQAQEKNAHETATKLTAARSDADGARRAANGLQKRIAALVSASRAPTNPGTEPAVDSAGAALDLLALMFSQSDEASGILAEYADAARIAGESCQRDYNALR